MSWQAYTNSGWKIFRLHFQEEFGAFSFTVRDQEVQMLQIESVLGSQIAYSLPSESGGYDWLIPFPTGAAFFDESGINFNYWSGFLSNATYVNILPYWHYAE
jgi:hypothetical protein